MIISIITIEFWVTVQQFLNDLKWQKNEMKWTGVVSNL